jgi:hypothetical protein
MKLSGLMTDLIQKHVLGKVAAHVYTIEYQKRGLVHAHILLIMEDNDKPKTPELIDRVVFAELPDRIRNPDLFAVIQQHNIHGPCGAMNLNSVCMDGKGKDRRCTKDFPKSLRRYTILPDDSYPEYRRRGPEQGGQTCSKKVGSQQFTVDNSFVVPFNPYLSLRYQAHLNVEVVHSIQAVKYLYKVIVKLLNYYLKWLHKMIFFPVHNKRSRQSSDEDGPGCPARRGRHVHERTLRVCQRGLLANIRLQVAQARSSGGEVALPPA